jgi:RNA-directed DNA polymerase
MNTTEETNSAEVTEGPKQAEEAWSQKWHWVEPTVWTKRMLEALERGVKGGKWFALIDKVHEARNLKSAFWSVKRNQGCPGCDGQRIEAFEAKLEEELARLSEELSSGKYRPHPVLRVYIEKPGSVEKRPLGIPAVRDRVVHTALKHVLEPIFEREFAPQSYGFRPGRGCKDALRRVDALIKAGYTHVVDADIKGYFDSIPHAALMERVRERVSDGKVLGLIEKMLEQGILSELKGWEPSAQGTPQGAVMSPLLANIYLHPLDLLMQAAGLEMIRYADDFAVLCRNQAEAEAALQRIREWVEGAGLQLHPEKTKLVDLNDPKAGFDFLGYHFRIGRRGAKRWPRRKSVQKLRAKLKAKTKRTNGRSLREIIQEINPTLRGWYGYFRHAVDWSLAEMDGWVRGRLRAILRKRLGQKGRARGRDHQRWPNAYFARHGLFNLFEAQKTAIQSRS